MTEHSSRSSTGSPSSDTSTDSSGSSTSFFTSTDRSDDSDSVPSLCDPESDTSTNIRDFNEPNLLPAGFYDSEDELEWCPYEEQFIDYDDFDDDLQDYGYRRAGTEFAHDFPQFDYDNQFVYPYSQFPCDLPGFDPSTFSKDDYWPDIMDNFAFAPDFDRLPEMETSTTPKPDDIFPGPNCSGHLRTLSNSHSPRNYQDEINDTVSRMATWLRLTAAADKIKK